MKRIYIACSLLLICIYSSETFASAKITCPSNEEIKNNLKASFHAKGGSDPYGVIAYIRTNIKIAGNDATGYSRFETPDNKEMITMLKGSLPIGDYIRIGFTNDAPIAVAENVSNAALLTCRYKIDYNRTWPSFSESEVWYASKLDYRQSYFNLLFKIDMNNCSAYKDTFDCK